MIHVVLSTNNFAETKTVSVVDTNVSQFTLVSWQHAHSYQVNHNQKRLIALKVHPCRADGLAAKISLPGEYLEMA